MYYKSRDKCVILITIDALRRDHLKSYGYHRNTAPNLERFVEKGTTFLNAFSNGPESPSSFSAIFSSIYPFLNGGYSPLPIQKKIFPEILHKNKIFSCAIHNNPHLGKFFNYNRGFDIFIEGGRNVFTKMDKKKIQNRNDIKPSMLSRSLEIINRKFVKKIRLYLKDLDVLINNIRYRFPILTDFLMHLIPVQYNAPIISKKIINILKRNKNNFFLFGHFMDVHNPYDPPIRNLLKFRRKNINRRERTHLQDDVFWEPHKYQITRDILNKIIDLYDGSINFVDEYLQAIFKFIISKFKKNCLIIITADHGDGLFEHDFFDHQGYIYDELLKVPLFIVEIGHKQHVKKINNLVQLIDIAPTILDYFGVPIPEDFQGISLLPLLEGKSIKRENFVISECYQKNGKIKRNNKEGFKLISIRNKAWKYIFDEEKKREYLFNLLKDPYEKNNLIKSNNLELKILKDILNDHLLEIKISNEKSKIKNVIDRLRLGAFL